MRKTDVKYRMPAEWEPHEGTWIAWPHYEPHWPGKIEPIPYVYAEMIRALIPSEKVYVCVNDAVMEAEARRVLAEKKVSFTDEQVKFFHIPTNASWSRDHGPIFVYDQNHQLAITHWKYNAYGDSWPYDLDDVVPQKIGEALHAPVVQVPMVLEGGSVDVNGQGTLLTTEACLLNPNRNPGWSREKIEATLKGFLGVTKILWLSGGPLAGDDTNAHVDSVARFVNENTVVAPREKNPDAKNQEALENNFAALQQMTNQEGSPLKVVALPMPEPVIYKGQQLPATYANFYIGNTVVLVPTFRCAQDEEAIKILKPFFPGRRVVGLDATDLVWGFGTFHCSTQQQPRR